MEDDVVDPLRVSQLDASELDSEIFGLLKTQLSSAFKYFKPGLLSNVNPEINALLRFIIWKYSIANCDATVGQQLLQLHYHDEVSASLTRVCSLTSRQKRLYGVFTILLPWLRERSHDFSSATSHLAHADKLWRVTELVLPLWRVAALINFALFLLNGKHQFIVERILGIRAVFPRRQGARQVGFDLMNRELLWHSFGEFLFFVLPLINFAWLRNMTTRWLFTTSKAESSDRPTIPDYDVCVVCGDWPNNARQIGCGHVFCYYCVQANYMADKSYTCPKCGRAISRMEDIKGIQINLSNF